MDLIKKISKDPVYLSLAVASIVLCASISLFDFFATHRIRTAAEKDAQVLLDHIEKDINVYLEQKKETLEKFISYLEKNQLIDLLDTPTYSNIYNQTQKNIEKGLHSDQFNDVSHITIISALNNIIYTTNPHLTYGTQFTSTLYEKNNFVQALIRCKMSSALDIMMFNEDQRASILLTMPIFSKKGYGGAIQVTLNTSILFDRLKETLISSNDFFLLFLIQSQEDLKLILFDSKTNSLELEKALESSIEQYPFTQASIGRKGSGITHNWNDQKIIAAWDYFPFFNIGFMVYKNYQTAIKPLRMITVIWVTLFILITLAVLISIYSVIKKKQLITLLRARKIVFLSFLIIISSALLIRIYKTFLLFDKAQFTLHNQAKSELENAVQQINLYICSIEALAYSLAIDLQTNHYSPDQLEKKLKDSLNSNAALYGITVAYKKFGYDTTIPYYAPMLTKTSQGVVKKDLETIIDYAAPESELDPHYSWYQKSLESGTYWSPPYVNEDNQLEYTYSIPFYNKENDFNGVIAIGFNLLEITKKINFTIGKNGYSFIIAPDGKLIYHPKLEYVIKQKTIFEVSSMADKHLNNLVKKMLSKEIPPISLQPIGIHGYYSTIPATHWLMGTVIYEKDATPDPISYLHNVLWIIILSAIMSIIICIICSLILFDENAEHYIATFSTIILAVSIVFISHFIRIYSLENAGIVPIKDNLSLDRQLNKIEQHAIAQNKQLPIKVETGIFIYDFSLKNYSTLVINAYVWQKYYDVLHKGIPRQVTFPQAYELTMKEIFRKKEHEYEVIGWNVSANVPLESSFDKYPFDTTIVSIVLSYPDLTRNILLIPDLSAYDKPLTLVNRTSQAELFSSGFYLKDDFFSYQKNTPETSFGVPELREQINDTLFTANMILVRNIANPLTLYITPMLVVFLSIFGILYLMKDRMLQWDKLFSAIAAYSATFFSILFIHRSLRETYPVSETLYLEYLFFIAYWLLFILTIRTIFPILNRIKFLGVDQTIVSLLYWPSILAIWFVITVMIFYNGSV